MVAALSIGRPKYAQHADLHAWANASGLALADRFLALADEDAAAYGEFAAAMKLPARHGRRARRPHDRPAGRRAPRVGGPAGLRRGLPRAGLDVAEALAGRSNVNAASDLNVAALLAEAAARGAAANVMINLPSIGDADLEGELMTRVVDLIAEVESLAAATHEAVGGEPRDAIPARARA